MTTDPRSRHQNGSAALRRRTGNRAAAGSPRARVDAEARAAYRLREIREDQVVTQKGASPSAWTSPVHHLRLEASDLDRSGLATLKAYVEALGGTVEVTAIFGNRKLVLHRMSSTAWQEPPGTTRWQTRCPRGRWWLAASGVGEDRGALVLSSRLAMPTEADLTGSAGIATAVKDLGVR